MMLDHRSFEEADAEIVCTFPISAEELFFMLPEAGYPLTPGRLLEAARAGHDSTVALADGQIAGYINFRQVLEKKFCILENLAVHPEYRRTGVAAYLVKIMVQIAMQRYAVRFVRASCFSHNKAAYALLHKLGFRPAEMGQRLGPDAEPFLVVHMHLPRRNWMGSQAADNGS